MPYCRARKTLLLYATISNLRDFVEEVNQLPDCCILELGARDSTVRNLFPHCVRYIGVDIHPGPGVDMVGDIHELSSILSSLNVSFDAVLTFSTFEHLVMPWKAILEINKIMKNQWFVVHSHPSNVATA
jgi:hypothetical protein